MENYIKTKIMSLAQITNKSMFVSTLSVEDIIAVVKFTERQVVKKDPFDLSAADENDYENQYYQRVKNSDRAYEIKKFFLKQIYNSYTFEIKQISPLAVFPSAILLGCQSYPEPIAKSEYIKSIDYITEGEDRPDYCFIDKAEILIPKQKNVLIIDGQHRIAGLENLLQDIKKGRIEIKKSDQQEIYIQDQPPLSYIEKTIKEFNFLVTFLIDFDRYEQAEIFAGVNFTQKPVNKSYYYDIFGSIKRGRSIEKLLHDLTAFLNFNQSSPLFGKIKMLGTGPGYISQAFLVEALMPHFKKGVFTDIFNNYMNEGNDFKKLPDYLKAYFFAFFDTFKDFLPHEEVAYKGVLLKTTGMGAIIQLLPHLNALTRGRTGKDPIDLKESEFEKQLQRILLKIQPSGNNYFGTDSAFSGSSSKGLQSKLYQKILTDLQTKVSS